MTAITIAHLADLHFGRHVPAIVDAVIADVHACRPDLVAVSGDLTQRSFGSQWRAVADFLGRLPRPVVAVPGNHDLPLHDPFTRTVSPRRGFRRHVRADTEPVVAMPGLQLVSLDTSRAWRWKDGSVSRRQLRRVRRLFATAPGTALRAIMMHHPCVVPGEFAMHDRVGNAEAALATFSQSGVELVLAGHMHDAYVLRTEADANRRPVPIVLSQAGTAVSTRRRTQPNSYNLVRATDAEIRVEIRSWTGSRFETSAAHRFGRLRPLSSRPPKPPRRGGEGLRDLSTA